MGRERGKRAEMAISWTAGCHASRGRKSAAALVAAFAVFGVILSTQAGAAPEALPTLSISDAGRHQLPDGNVFDDVHRDALGAQCLDREQSDWRTRSQSETTTICRQRER